MPGWKVKVLYISDGDDWGEPIRKLTPQVMEGCPVLIWDAGGMCGFLARSVEGDMMNVNWLAQLMVAVSAELLMHEKAGNTSEN